MEQKMFIKTENLKKYFPVRDGFLHAVDGVNLSIDKGKTLGVVGESGCGKSTLGRLMLNLIPATEGSVFVDGVDILKLPKKNLNVYRRNMQFIMQDPFASVNPRMIVRDIIADPLFVNRVYTKKRDIYKKVDELMEVVGLPRRVTFAYPHELDGGRRQRVGIARAIALNPEFIVCDEPVSALDVSVQAQTLNLLMDLQDDLGLTYMFITHDLSVVKHISQEIIVMYLGKVIERGNSDILFENPLHPYTQALLKAIPIPNIDYYNDNELEIIEGEVVSPINPSKGCRFAPRCTQAFEDCFKKDIDEYQLKDQYVSCLLYK